MNNDIYVDDIKIKQIGGNPYEIAHNAKDILIWLECDKNKDHPSYLITPYQFTKENKKCPLCDGRKQIILD
jgi:hypothetical protein